MDEIQECSICHSEIYEQPINFCCGQNYHYFCISEWFNQSETCPICKIDIDKRILENLKLCINILKNINKKVIHKNVITASDNYGNYFSFEDWDETTALSDFKDEL